MLSHRPESVFINIDPQKQYEKNQLFLARGKLKASSRTSALLSGFAMIAMIELKIDDSLPNGLVIVFSMCTVVLVSVHLLALMISTCLLPHVEASAAALNDTTSATLSLIPQQNDPFKDSYQPHLHMKKYIDMAWMCSTVIGIMLFMLEITLIVWLQFHAYLTASICATAVLLPIICIFFWIIIKFYRKLFKGRVQALRHALDMTNGFSDTENAFQRDGSAVAATASAESPTVDSRTQII